MRRSGWSAVTTPRYQPADNATFRLLLAHYDYDARPLEPVIERRTVTPAWTLERITYNGPANERDRLSFPALVVNGREDEEHVWLTRGLPLWNLLTEPKELKLFEGAGHKPLPEQRIPAIREFLDRHLSTGTQR